MMLFWAGIILAIDLFAGNSVVLTSVVDQIESLNRSVTYQVSSTISLAP